MKRYLLTAASALVLTAAAGAQTFQIGGQTTVEMSYFGNTFNGPDIGSHHDDELYLSFSGSLGDGWTFEVRNDILWDTYWDGSEITISNETLGRFNVSEQQIEWEVDLLGDALTVTTQFDPSDVIGSLQFGLEGTAAGVSYEAEIYNNASRDFQLQLGMPLFGVDAEAAVMGNLADTSSLAYEIELSADVFDVETYVSFGAAGNIGLEAAMGPFSVAGDLTDGDVFDDITLSYGQELSEQAELDIQVTFNGMETQACSALTLRF